MDIHCEEGLQPLYAESLSVDHEVGGYAQAMLRMIIEADPE